MFSFFKRRASTGTATTSLSWLGVDMHSHILPGIDDGSATLADSLLLLEQLQELGMDTFYFTPHVFQELYPNTPNTITQAFEELKTAVDASILGGYAAEYMLDHTFDQRLHAQEKFLTLPGNYLLVEMSYIQENKHIERTLFDLQIQGYKPILAHPERYVFYHHDIKKIQRFRDLGVLLQCNMLSAIGYYGPGEKQTFKRMAEKGLIDLLGTDMHHERHAKALRLGLQQLDLQKAVQGCRIRNQELFARS
jgi:protein-tyrosine phosphatase